MNKSIVSVTALLLLVIGVRTFSFGENHPCQFVFGRWQVYRTIDLATDDIASFPRDEEGALKAYWASDKHKLVASIADNLVSYIIGKEFKFAKDYMVVNGTKYKDPIYELTKKVDSRINVINLSLYATEAGKEKEKRTSVQIPFPGYDLATFYIERLIMYKDEIIMPFYMLKTGDDVYNCSWLRYLCLRKIA